MTNELHSDNKYDWTLIEEQVLSCKECKSTSNIKITLGITGIYYCVICECSPNRGQGLTVPEAIYHWNQLNSVQYNDKQI